MRSVMFFRDDYKGDGNYTVSSYVYTMVSGRRIIFLFVPQSIGLCLADVTALWQVILRDADMAGCGRVSPRTDTRTMSRKIADHCQGIKVWIPMNDGGHWRLCIINPSSGIMMTYDPMGLPDHEDIPPAHFHILERVLANVSLDWCHAYAESLSMPRPDIQRTGVWLLRILDSALQNKDFCSDKVSNSKLIRSLTKACQGEYQCIGLL